MSTSSRVAALGFAGLGLAGALAGCSAGTPAGPAVDTSAVYTDGTYTADGSYVVPSGTESVTVELTLKGDIVTNVVVTGHATDPQAIQHQSEFAGGIAAVVVGKDIDTLQVSRVGGSSFTSIGFNKALAEIKADAVQS
ncbi:MAG: hypothetical protein ABIR17_10870 [Pseudolysinimonas sp.]|uniref:hypothetical protein n=1 Tax=Pseudolysinimonas sp. TaxID=2680009 RepID=UPI003264DA4F